MHSQRFPLQVEVSAADFTQRDVTQPACKHPSPDDLPYHTPQPGINMASTSFDESQCCRVPEPDIALAYTVSEPDRSGTLVMPAVEALGVHPGQCNALKSGRTVVTDAGVTVHPEQVCACDQAFSIPAKIRNMSVTCHVVVHEKNIQP